MAILRERLCKQFITEGSALAYRQHRKERVWSFNHNHIYGTTPMDQNNYLKLIPKLGLFGNWQKKGFFSNSNKAEAQRCPQLKRDLGISKLIYQCIVHQMNTAPGVSHSYLSHFFQLVLGLLLAERSKNSISHSEKRKCPAI